MAGRARGSGDVMVTDPPRLLACLSIDVQFHVWRLIHKDVTAGDVFLRILVHNHEHMGQAIAYARMKGIVPPWSARGQ